MSGITGFWDVSQSLEIDKLKTITQRMSQTLIHRGLDHSGSWFDVNAGISLGIQELLLSNNCQENYQPMTSKNGRYVIIFDGEIYNSSELRSQLQQLGYHFQTNSYAELMLAIFSYWSINNGINKCNGMFAFALWDRQERLLHLGRDRLGKKPLYYGWLGKTLVFSSELKALKVYPGFNKEVNRDVLALFVRYGYIPYPYSIYQDIYQVPSGTILTWNGNHTEAKSTTYWSLQSLIETALNSPFTGSEIDAVNEMETLLKDAVKSRIKGDATVGSCLSSGIDSTIITTLTQSQSPQPIKTFTIGFEEAQYNEAEYAQETAQYLGTDHTELFISAKDALKLIPKLPTIYDEPFADISQIPSFMLFQLAKKFVDVNLTGDGGDEMFVGVSNYDLGLNIWRQIGWIPSNLRQILGRGLTQLSPQTWDLGLGFLATLFPYPFRYGTPGEQIHKFADFLEDPTPETIYRRVASHWREPENLVLNSSEPITVFTNEEYRLNTDNFLQKMRYLDMLTWLPDDICVKVDRASMAVGLETRMPFFDYRLIELAWRIPLSIHLHHPQGKYVLRQILAKYLPQELIERPKMGFGMPLFTWLRQDLRDWAESLLDQNKLRQQGFFNPQPIQQKWAEHLAGKRNWEHYLWDVLMFQAWLENH